MFNNFKIKNLKNDDINKNDITNNNVDFEEEISLLNSLDDTDPCPCSSGLSFRDCHIRLQQAVIDQDIISEKNIRDNCQDVSKFSGNKILNTDANIKEETKDIKSKETKDDNIENETIINYNREVYLKGLNKNYNKVPSYIQYFYNCIEEKLNESKCGLGELQLYLKEKYNIQINREILKSQLEGLEEFNLVKKTEHTDNNTIFYLWSLDKMNIDELIRSDKLYYDILDILSKQSTIQEVQEKIINKTLLDYSKYQILSALLVLTKVGLVVKKEENNRIIYTTTTKGEDVYFLYGEIFFYENQVY